ncbi:MAG: ExbD/TolR family protein, partial [Endomicrobiales bacterium]
EINITPFTDVVLVLLIIFMVTTPLLLQPGIKVQLPRAKAAETDTDKTMNVLVDARGDIYLDKKKVALEELKREISLKLMHRPELAVVVKGDKDVRYDMVIQVIDAAKQAGVKKFALAVELQQVNPAR